MTTTPPNNGGRLANFGAPGQRESVSTTARGKFDYLSFGLKGAGIFALALLVGVLVLGFTATLVIALAGLIAFGVKAFALAVVEARQFKQTNDNDVARVHLRRCASFAIAVVAVGAVGITLVVKRDAIREYWPMPEVRMHEYQPAATLPVPVFDDNAVFLPLVGGGSPPTVSDIEPGPSAILEIDGRPVVEMSDGWQRQFKHARGAFIIAGIVVLIGVGCVLLLSGALIASNTQEIVNPNQPAPTDKAPWYAPTGWSIASLFNKRYRDLQLAAIAQSLGVPLDSVQPERVHETITITALPNGNHGTQYKTDWSWVTLAQWEALTPIVIADGAVTADHLHPLSKGRPFTRTQADKFRDIAMHAQFIEDIGSNQNQLTTTGAKFFGDEKWRQWFLTPTTTS